MGLSRWISWFTSYSCNTFFVQFLHPKITSKQLGHKGVFITLRMFYLGCKNTQFKNLVNNYLDNNVYKYKNAVSPSWRNRTILKFLLDFELTRIQIKVKPSIFHKRFVIPSFKNTSIFYNKDLICFFNRFQSMSDYKTCSTFH